MKKVNPMKKLILVLLFIVVISGACSAPAAVQPTQLEPAVIVSTNTPLPTATDLPTATATAAPTLTPTIRPPKILIPTATLPNTATPGPTPKTVGGLIWPRAHFTEANVSWRQTACAVPGKNLSCEMEYRKDSSGGCYIGMSCYDDCGWYYSVNTIPAGVEEFSGPCW